jgi:hypothetical protein
MTKPSTLTTLGAALHRCKQLDRVTQLEGSVLPRCIADGSSARAFLLSYQERKLIITWVKSCCTSWRGSPRALACCAAGGNSSGNP